MPSPDLPGYIDLTLEDRGPAELVERAAANLPVSNPGHVWEPASVEAAVVESLALIASEVDYQINRLPAVIFETLAGRLGVAYDQGEAPVATVDITFADNAGYALAAGSRLVLEVDGTPVIFTLDVDAVAAPGGAFVNAVPVTGAAFTAIANGVAVGTPLDLLDNFAPYQSAVLDTSPAGGAGPETVSSWFDRVAARLQRLTEVLSAPTQFEAAAVDLEPAVVRVKALDRFDPGSGNAAAAKLDLGHVTVVVGGANGVPLTAPQKTALEAALEDAARVELDVHLIDPTITAVEVDVTVERLADYTAVEVAANVRAALNDYLDPNTWPWAGTVYRNELISVIDQAEGVSRVKVLATPAADVAVAGNGPLADFLDTVASVVTVDDPA